MSQKEHFLPQVQMGWESPANIALVKYWGKYPIQKPMNPSVSFVLSRSVVRLVIGFGIAGRSGSGLHHFTLNGQPNEGFRKRLAGFIESLIPSFPFLRGMALSISSESTFPHSAGIASSAAAFSALALCICEMQERVKTRSDHESSPGSGPTDAAAMTPDALDVINDAVKPIHTNRRNALLQDADFIRSASNIARLGSGSACRSLQDGFVVWGKTPLLGSASDDYGVRVDNENVANQFNALRDAVLIVDDTTKKVSSSAGHALMHGHAYRENRVAQANGNLSSILNAIRTGDEELFFNILENEALSLHSLMMSSNPGYILMRPNTITLLEKIRDFREQNKVSLGFTMDAGPNIHLIYFERDRQTVHAWISSELAPLCKDKIWIDDAMGRGPQPL